MAEKLVSSRKRRTSASLFKYIIKKRNPLIVSAISFLLGGVIVGTASGILQEWFKQLWLSKKAKVNLQLVNSSYGVFTDTHSEKVIQIMTYKVSVSDFTRDIKITATFSEPTMIRNCYVTYTVDLKGFKCVKLQKNHVELTLDHPLDASKKAYIYLWTEREFTSDESAKSEVPDIHIQGRARNEKTVYW